MYENVKSRIIFNGEKSELFTCEMGVRQGENLSPALFAIFLNDLQHFFEGKDVLGVNSISDDLEHELTVFLKIFMLLYADDTVMFSESSEDLQNMLNEFDDYCEKGQLKINVSKTKVLIFSKGRQPKNIRFFLYRIEK